MNLREAAQQALEVLEKLDEQELATGDLMWLGKEIGDLRSALEPVTTCHELYETACANATYKVIDYFCHTTACSDVNVTYIRKILDEFAEQAICCKGGDKLSLPFDHFPDAGKMVATGQESRQVEPVAWTTKGQMSAMENGFQHYIHGRVPRFVSPTEDDVPLYTAPPKHKPLTDEELFKLGAESHEDIAYARAIERAIWEKNGG